MLQFNEHGLCDIKMHLSVDKKKMAILLTQNILIDKEKEFMFQSVDMHAHASAIPVCVRFFSSFFSVFVLFAHYRLIKNEIKQHMADTNRIANNMNCA